jgi:uncharacterized repeat protein (TIGR03847 family)
MGASFDFDGVEAFVPGTVGEPGSRVFYLQVRADRTVTLRCEKQQVAALGEYLGELLSELGEGGELPFDPPPFVEPTDVAWIVGGLGAAYDADDDRFVVVAEEAVPVDEEGEPVDGDEQGTVRVRLTRRQVSQFVLVAEALVTSGRPTCIFCGNPIDADGHVCVRMN